MVHVYSLVGMHDVAEGVLDVGKLLHVFSPKGAKSSAQNCRYELETLTE